MKINKIQKLINKKEKDTQTRLEKEVLERLQEDSEIKSQGSKLNKISLKFLVTFLMLFLLILGFIFYNFSTQNTEIKNFYPYYNNTYITQEIKPEVTKEIINNITNTYSLIPELQAKCTRITVIGSQQDNKTYTLLCTES